MAERYRQMSDEELLLLVPESSELTPFAQQALANEVRSRGLKAETESEKPSGRPSFKPPAALFEHKPPKFRDSDGDDSSGDDSSGEESSYDEDRKLVDYCTVWSARDAAKVQALLDEAGIPFFMGAELATSVEAVTSKFADGVSVMIMQVGVPWAQSAMRMRYEPEDDPTPKVTEELEELPVRCPKCHSTEVVFDGLTSEPGAATGPTSQKYKWTCDSCGNRWEDDGVAKEE